MLKNYIKNDHIDQNRDLNLYFRDYIGEPILNPLISYPDMRTNYSIGITDLRHQLDHISSKGTQLFQESGTDPDNARLFLNLFLKKRN